MKRGIREIVWLVAAASVAGGSWNQPALAADAAVQTSDSATETGTLTLERSIHLALAHNPELRAAGSRVEAAAGRAYQAGRWPNPELELAAEDWPAGGPFSEAKQTLGLSQTLPFPGKKKLEGEVGLAGMRATEAELELRRRELVREVKVAFFRVLAARELVKLAGRLVEIAEAAAQAARRRVEAGAAADQEQLRAEIALEQARAERAGLERELIISRRGLVTLLGRPAMKDVPISGSLAETVDVARFDHPPEQWLAAHPSVVAARTSREQAELELRRAKLEPYPDVKLGVAGGRESGADHSSIVELRVSFPLPVIDRAKGRKLEARANAAIAAAQTEAVEQRLRQTWGATLERLRAAQARANAYRERILPKAEEALRLVQRGFEEGKFGLIDLLDTQRTAAETRRAYVETLLELNTAMAELETLLGTTPGLNQASTAPQRE